MPVMTSALKRPHVALKSATDWHHHSSKVKRGRLRRKKKSIRISQQPETVPAVRPGRFPSLLRFYQNISKRFSQGAQWDALFREAALSTPLFGKQSVLKREAFLSACQPGMWFAWQCEGRGRMASDEVTGRDWWHISRPCSFPAGYCISLLN